MAMFSLVLDCPFCSKRFDYDHGGQLPEEITCPLCGGTASKENFSALIFCQDCRKKLKVPLDLLYEEINCPHCNARLQTDQPFEAEDISTYTLGGTRHKAADRMLNDGDIFDKYRIIRMLGKGGMAEVYLAEHLLLKQYCALKLMQNSLLSEDPIFTKRFIREAKLSHQFDHPNIVKVVDAGTDYQTGHLFLAMEYVEGKTLSQLIREKQLSSEELLEILYSMLDALKVLNAAHVVHRDIKPSNIMLCNTGEYKLMDLGIAKSQNDHQAGELTLTVGQSTLGTPGYASPEQCRSAHDADCRSDIYCLGATLYHAAAGVIPFDGDTTMEIILKVIQEEPEPLKKYRPDLPPQLLNLISRMMAKNPDDRPESPEKVIEILGQRKNPLPDTVQILKKMSDALFLSRPQSADSEKKRRKRSLRSCFLPLCLLILLVLAVINFRTPKLQEIQETTLKENSLEEKEDEKLREKYINFLRPYPRIPRLIARGLNDRTIERRFPKLQFTSDDRDSILFRKTFDRSEKNKIAAAAIRGDALDAARLKKSGGGEKYTIDWQRKNPSGCTLSMQLCFKKDTSAFLVLDNDIIMRLKQNAFDMCFPGENYISVRAPFKPETWFDLTVIFDCERRRLTVASGSSLIAAYRLPEFDLALRQKLGFFSQELQLGFSGKIKQLTVYDTPRAYTVTPPKPFPPRPRPQIPVSQRFIPAAKQTTHSRLRP